MFEDEDEKPADPRRVKARENAAKAMTMLRERGIVSFRELFKSLGVVGWDVKYLTDELKPHAEEVTGWYWLQEERRSFILRPHAVAGDSRAADARNAALDALDAENEARMAKAKKSWAANCQKYNRRRADEAKERRESRKRNNWHSPTPLPPKTRPDGADA